VIAHFLFSFLKEPVENLVFNIGLMWGNLFTLIFLLLAALGVMILLFKKIHGKQITVKRQAEAIKPAPDVNEKEKKSLSDILFIIAVVFTVLLTLRNTAWEIFLILK
jgi:hypothetical protein